MAKIFSSVYYKKMANVYTNTSCAHAADQMAKITEFRKKSGSKKKDVKPTQLQRQSL